MRARRRLLSQFVLFTSNPGEIQTDFLEKFEENIFLLILSYKLFLSRVIFNTRDAYAVQLRITPADRFKTLILLLVTRLPTVRITFYFYFSNIKLRRGLTIRSLLTYFFFFQNCSRFEKFVQGSFETPPPKIL